MSSGWPRPGLGTTAAYQVSGIPYVTSSGDGECTATGNVIQIKFPRVTRWFEVAVSGSAATTGNLRIGFTENGVNSLGAVTSSVYTGVINEFDNQVWVNAEPYPTSAEQWAGHKNYFVVGSNAGGTSGAAGVRGTSTGRLELACTDLFLRADDAEAVGFTIIAGLTNIPRSALNITGSAGYHGVG